MKPPCGFYSSNNI